MHKYVGTEQIIRFLLQECAAEEENRSIEDRYNIILEAIYGENYKEILFIDSGQGRPNSKTKSGNPYWFLLLDMYEAWTTGEYKSFKDLAEHHIDEMEFHGNRTIAVKNLASDFSKALSDLENPRFRESVIHSEISHIRKVNNSAENETLNSLIRELNKHGWKIPISY